jgi:hypothetical protein
MNSPKVGDVCVFWNESIDQRVGIGFYGGEDPGYGWEGEYLGHHKCKMFQECIQYYTFENAMVYEGPQTLQKIIEKKY